VPSICGCQRLAVQPGLAQELSLRASPARAIWPGSCGPFAQPNAAFARSSHAAGISLRRQFAPVRVRAQTLITGIGQRQLLGFRHGGIGPKLLPSGGGFNFGTAIVLPAAGKADMEVCGHPASAQILFTEYGPRRFARKCAAQASPNAE